ncbi:MAG: hypothetical protein EXR72_13755 [Myxococcales bacterium]|nr:hypothetical protein [Myxococcales bacterium]
MAPSVHRLALFAVPLAAALAGCSSSYATAAPPSPAAPAAPPPVDVGPIAALTAHPDLPAERRTVQVVGGAERVVDAEEAVRGGFTLVDLRDQWTPYIFTEIADPAGAPMINRYRSIFLGLAADRSDADGQPLPAREHNYLELFGIPPTLSVLAARFRGEGAGGQGGGDPCAAVDLARIRAVTSIPLREAKSELKERARIDALARKLEGLREQAHAATIAELASTESAKLTDEVNAVTKALAARAAFAEVEKRLRCEGLFAPRARHATGRFDDAMREAVIRFQRKHKLYDAAALRPDTLAALGRSLLENDHAALVRVLTERVVAAANLLEDGSVGTAATYQGASGQTLPVRNLVDESLRAALAQLGLDTPEGALAFFRRRSPEDFSWLRVAVKLPPPPEYHSPSMDLSVEIDRGDVIYDPLFDEKGRPTNQTRRRFPMITLRTKYREQIIPLLRWRTTIGGWRSDLASNGYEYYRYKGSDVGPRVWRNVVAGPVWIAPNSTPVRSLVKYKVVQGASQQVVNYDEVGPGYLSAYGLVAAYNVVPGKDGKPDWDNGVRVHGSSEILSIRNPNAYSHGCHRLMNHLAVRLFSFVLQHRPVVITGDRTLNFTRQFLWKEDVYEMRLPSRGFWYEFDPPIPVNVLEGNILGKAKKPITIYVPKPEVEYPPGPIPIPQGSPEARAGGGGDE